MRYDILQHAHALRAQEMLAVTDASLLLVMDDDKGLQQAFQAAFVDEIRLGWANIAVVSLDTGMTNDMRLTQFNDGRSLLSTLSGMSLPQIQMLSSKDCADLMDQALTATMRNPDMLVGVPFPFPRKSEPNKVVRVPTWRPKRSIMSAARLVQRATLRGVDAYFHKVQSDVRFASRPRSRRGTPNTPGTSSISTSPGCSPRWSRSTAFTTTGATLGWTGKRPR